MVSQIPPRKYGEIYRQDADGGQKQHGGAVVGYEWKLSSLDASQNQFNGLGPWFIGGCLYITSAIFSISWFLFCLSLSKLPDPFSILALTWLKNTRMPITKVLLMPRECRGSEQQVRLRSTGRVRRANSSRKVLGRTLRSIIFKRFFGIRLIEK